jgi:hypothetical protein
MSFYRGVSEKKGRLYEPTRFSDHLLMVEVANKGCD